jgi:inner membrane protein
MATIFTHTFVAASLGKAVFPEKMPARFWVLTIVCTVLPDIDVIGFRFGIRYADALGHRGFSHSLTFAALIALLVTVAAFPAVLRFSKRWWLLTGYFFLVSASHGLLDSMTDGGYGIAFLSPFDLTRYFFPWQPLHVSPIGIRGFLSPYGMRILLNEFLWIGVPFLAFLLPLMWHRRALRRASSSPCPKKQSASKKPCF